MSVSVDLGCGDKPRNPFNAEKIIGVDRLAPLQLHNRFENQSLTILQADLAAGIPLESEFADYVTAYDFLEHVPRIGLAKSGAVENPFINIVNEVFRILKVGGTFLHSTPLYPHPFAFVDPTHVNYITEKTFNYFCGPFLRGADDSAGAAVGNDLYGLSRSYGITSEFVIESTAFTPGRTHIMQILRKP
jgi:hypothetical protein